MKVLLTGYGGNLGRPLARALTSAGHQVTALLYRRAIDRRDLDQGVEIAWGSLMDTARVEALLGGVDAVVHGAWDYRARRGEDYQRVNVDAALGLLVAAARATVRHFVSISSVAVYGLDPSPDGEPFAEDAPYVSDERALDAYPRSKVRLEQGLRDRATALGLPLTIVRPGLLFSDDQVPAKRLLRLGRRRIALLVGHGRNHLPYVHADDVADLVVLALQHAPAGVQAFNAVPSVATSVARFARSWGRQRGYAMSTLRVPAVCFRAAGFAAFRLKRLLGRGGSPPNLAYQSRTGIRDVRYSAAAARAVLGWSDHRTRAIAEGQS